MHDDSVTMQHGTGVEMDAPSFAARPKRPGEVEVTSVFDDVVADSSLLSSMEAQVDSPNDPGLAAPVTPPVIAPQLPQLQGSSILQELMVMMLKKAMKQNVRSWSL